MKLPTDETPSNMNGDGYLSDEYDQLEMMPAPIRDGDFSEYMWMENEEEFNSQVLRELEEEELMEQCIVAMLDDEESQQANNNSRTSTIDDPNPSVNGLSESVNNLSISSNGVRNNNNVSSDNSANTCASNNSSRPFSVQDRLRRHRVTQPSLNNETSETEHKSTLNPDAKEFVPIPRSTVQSKSENENVPS